MLMDSRKTSFLQALRLPPDLADEACTHAISELISLAARDQSHSVSLNDIHEAVFRYACAEYLEPLEVLPILLRCGRDGAMDLIRTCALNSSPKELVIVVQEAIEHLETHLNYDEDEGDDSDLVQRVIGIVVLCSPAISRSTLGKRSALELCSPVLENATSLVSSVSPSATKEEGRLLVAEVARLVKSLSVWASAVADANGLRGIEDLLRELLDTTVVGCAPSIQASLAIRAAESYFPRYFVKSSAKEGWQDGEGAMLEVQLALDSLGNAPKKTRWRPGSFSDVVYLAHSTPPVDLTGFSPSDLYRLLVNALEMNAVVDASLFLLFRMLTHENMDMSPDVASSLCTVLTALASTHLDPTIRELSLRLLSLTLSKLPPYARMEMLSRLTTDEDFPQIRGPAVGFVKEATLEALAGEGDGNPFGSPELLRVFGGVLFRPNPPEFLRERRTGEELAGSLELLRIADCLSFYYVLLRRDRENKTGVRSKGTIASVQKSVLQPLERFLDEHAEREVPLMSSLRVGLDRIYDAVGLLDLDLER